MTTPITNTAREAAEKCFGVAALCASNIVGADDFRNRMAQYIQSAITAALNQQREEAEKRIKAADKLAEAADEAHGYLIEIFQREGSSTTDDELERKLRVAIVEYARAAQEGSKV